MGLLITLEGIDGSGKTTQAMLIQDYLKEKGHDVLFIREPGGTRIGEELRNILLDASNKAMSNKTELFLYLAARAQLISDVIKPALDNKKVVICDRFIDSTYVYQSYGRGIDFRFIESLNSFVLDGLTPDITFFFDIAPEISIKRRLSSSEADRIENEKIEFFNRVYLGYKELCKIYKDRIITIDATLEKLEIFNNIKKHLATLLRRGF